MAAAYEPVASPCDELVAPGTASTAASTSSATPPLTGCLGCLERYFKVYERGSTFRREMFAGLVNFLANAYLLVVIPQMLGHGTPEIPKDVFLFGLAVSSCVTSICLGLLSNLPVPAGCGVACAAYFAYSLANDFPRGKATFASTTCLMAGALMSVMAICGLSWRLFRLIPDSVKEAMPVGLGFMLTLCGFQQMRLVVSNSDTGVTMGNLAEPNVIFGCLGAYLMVFLHSKKAKAAFVVPIILMTCVGWVASSLGWLTFLPNGAMPPKVFVRIPELFWADKHITVAEWGAHEVTHAVAASLSMYIICLFDVAGITYSIGKIAGLVDARGHLPGAYWVFVCCGVGSMLSATLGCSPVIILGEAFAGVLVGGRTGISAIFMGLCFLLVVPLAPIFTAIPIFASAPVLVIIGLDLLPMIKNLELREAKYAFPSFCTIILMPLLYSIDRAIIAGLLTHLVMFALDGLWWACREPRAARAHCASSCRRCCCCCCCCWRTADGRGKREGGGGGGDGGDEFALANQAAAAGTPHRYGGDGDGDGDGGNNNGGGGASSGEPIMQTPDSTGRNRLRSRSVSAVMIDTLTKNRQEPIQSGYDEHLRQKSPNLPPLATFSPNTMRSRQAAQAAASLAGIDMT